MSHPAKTGEKIEIFTSFGNESESLAVRVKDASERGFLGERLYSDLCLAKREQLDWNIFYSLLELPSEKEGGYWLSTKVAATLLEPAILAQFVQNQNARINERVEDDFLSEVIMEIQRVIPMYDKKKSEFPNYIKLYIKQCGYVHNKDASVYLQKRKGIRVFSQNRIAGDGKENGRASSADGFANVAAATTVEEEIEKKEAKRNSAIFSAVVEHKALSSQEDKALHKKARQLRRLKDKERLLRITDKKKDSPGNRHRIEQIERILTDPANRKTLDSDWKNTIVGACIWSKFLGGAESHGEAFLNKISDMIEEAK